MATLTQPAAPAAQVRERISLKKKPRLGESLIKGFLFTCGAISIFTTVGIVLVLATEALVFFTTPGVNPIDFVTDTVWAPEAGRIGILPLVTATVVTSFIAMLISLPIGLSSAIYLSEYATPKARSYLKPILELLAGIPTVVYGYFAVTFMTPLLRNIFGAGVVEFYNMASAGLVMGIMITPIVASMSEDALSAVPRGLREASFGLGATKLETSLRVVVPSAISGIAAAFIVGVSRAFGETMIVALAAGAGPNFTFDPFKAAETMTGHIARISSGDLSFESIDYTSIFAVGLMLFFLTMILNMISRWFVRRYREVY